MRKTPPNRPSAERRAAGVALEPRRSRARAATCAMLVSASWLAATTIAATTRAADQADATLLQHARPQRASNDEPVAESGTSKRGANPIRDHGARDEKRAGTAGNETSPDHGFADKPIARLGDHTITADDLEPNIAFQVYRQKLDTYTLLVRAVNDLVERRLLAAEAERRGISLEELERLLEEEGEPASPADVDAYLAKNPAAAAEANARERAAYYLTEQRRIQTRLDIVDALRDRAHFKMLLKPPRQPRTSVSTADAPARGPEDAPLVLVHFASFTSERSAVSAEQIRRLERELPGRIRWVHRSLPGEHDELAVAAAELAAEAQEKGKFWELHDRLFELRGDVKASDLERIAADLGIAAVHPGDTRYLEAVKRDADEARRIGIAEEPVIFVNGRYVSPAFPYAELRALVANELGEAAERPAASRRQPARGAVPAENPSDDEP